MACTRTRHCGAGANFTMEAGGRLIEHRGFPTAEDIREANMSIIGLEEFIGHPDVVDGSVETRAIGQAARS
jgi:hypothetical protein